MTDTLVLYLSEDNWLGDAEAEITVNGTAIGGILDVTATNASDDVGAFTFTGNFGPTPTVALSFINDAYGGMPAEDRNLYLDGFAYDGVLQLSDKLEESYDQTQTFELTSTPQVAERAAAFTGGIGVGVHLDYTNTSYGTFSLVQAALSYLGVTDLRVAPPDPQTLPELEALGAAGYRFDMGAPNNSTTATLATQLAADNVLAPYIIAIEGPNEVNINDTWSWNGQHTLAAAAAYQAAIWQAVRADPSLSSVAVYAESVGGGELTQAYQALGNFAPYATDGNLHVYFPYDLPPLSTMLYNIALAQASEAGMPLVITETNYATTPLGGGVNAAVQESYDLDLLMDAAKEGVQTTYLYELLDEAPDPNQTNAQDDYGLFYANGTPKPAATAIHNLVALLSDTGSIAASFTPGALSYGLAGLPASGDSYLLEKSNGVYELAVWAEPVLWNFATQTETPATPRSVTLTLPTAEANIKVFDPEVGTAPIAEYGNTGTATFTITDHPLIIQVTPTLAITTLGSGPDDLKLFLTEDAYQGDAEFTIAIDGVQIGGTFTADALAGSGLAQEIDIYGTFSGTHTLSVHDLNDIAAAGVGDRNLYLDSASINGTTIANAPIAFTASGTKSFAFDADQVIAVNVTGSAGTASSNGSGGNGGNAPPLIAAATGRVAEVTATGAGGAGGSGSGAGKSGGAGGSISGGAAAADGVTAASVLLTETGGAGGVGSQGAAGGSGGLSLLVSLVAGSTNAGTLSLSQTAIGGNGGASDTGPGGAGGIAKSNLMLDDATNPTPSNLIFVTLEALGGNGGRSGSAVGTGGGATISARVTGAGAVNTDASADGGAGAQGGAASVTSVAIGGVAHSTANAVAGSGETGGATAYANAQAAGASSLATGTSATTLGSGGALIGESDIAAASGGGAANGLSISEVGQSVPSAGLWVWGGEAYSELDGLPSAAAVAPMLAGAPKTIAVFGTGSKILAAGEVGGGHSGSGTAVQTITASAAITLNQLQLPATQDLFLSFTKAISGSPTSGIDLAVLANGGTLVNQIFVNVTDATNWLTDHPLDLGALGSSSLAASPTLNLQVELSLTSTGGGVYAAFVVGDAAAASQWAIL
jgi:hypothetical protein